LKKFLGNTRRFLGHLDKAQRIQSLGIISLMFVVSAVELIGLGIIIPVAAILMDDSAYNSDGFLRDVWLSAGSPDRPTFTLIAVIAIVFTYLFRAAFLVLFAWAQSGYVQSIKLNFSRRLFRKYISLTVLQRRKKSSSDFLRNLGVELSIFIDFVLGPVLVLIAEAFVMITVVSLLLVFQPLAAFTISIVFIISMGSFTLLTRKRVTKWSSERLASDQVRLRIAKEALEALVEIKSLGREKVFTAEFEDMTLKSLATTRKFAFVSQIPRLWMETSAVVALCAALCVFVIQEMPVSSIMASLGLFAVAAFRLLPSANRLVTSVQSIKFGFSSFSQIVDELPSSLETLPNANAGADVKKSFQNLSVSNLKFSYSGDRVNSIEVPHFEIFAGEIIGISGPSGSGKTTFIDTLTGLIHPENGNLVVDGVGSSFGTKTHTDLFAYVNQSPYMLDRTLEENITFGLPSSQVDRDLLNQVIEIAQIGNLHGSVLGPIGDSGSNLSGGQKQRIAIARALYKGSPILVLDEGTSALDQQTELDFFEAVELVSKTKTIVLVTHDDRLLAKCDQIYEMSKGVLIKKQ
jgi:ABC-type bacteriocin/lantibiotic exporter with double-glycine peptidase domain